MRYTNLRRLVGLWESAFTRLLGFTPLCHQESRYANPSLRCLKPAACVCTTKSALTSSSFSLPSAIAASTSAWVISERTTITFVPFPSEEYGATQASPNEISAVSATTSSQKLQAEFIKKPAPQSPSSRCHQSLSTITPSRSVN